MPWPGENFLVIEVADTNQFGQFARDDNFATINTRAQSTRERTFPTSAMSQIPAQADL